VKRKTIWLLLAFAFVGRAFAAEILVSAAASLTDVLREMAPSYEAKSGDKLIFNLGASSMLARQIQEGAPSDVFFSADEEKMDALQKKGLIRKDSRKSLLSNTLVIVVANDSAIKIQSAHDLKKARRIAIAEPTTVPAGIYARQYLEKIGLWTKLIDSFIPTDNVRAALAAVESGNVDAGIVYKTDAGMSKKVKIAFEVPVSEGPKISYPVAVVKDSKSLAAAEAFVKYLASDEASAVFTKYGFIVNR
jgi:molybdate transport system substrate-binding protein